MTETEAIEETTEDITNPEWLGRDTCDLCGPGVLAFVRAVKGEKELTYCGSCGKRTKIKLALWADYVEDLTHLIGTR